ncbi:MAG: RNA polymerase sigma-54 factor [Chlamydiae bacterium]|nr:RNA polymerase sigma-54 factor [Chlamydiota bacterium]
MSYPIFFEQKQKLTQGLKQNQLLMMLPQMQQAISLLQSPIMEISQLIDCEIEKNPLIEIIEEVAEECLAERDDPEEVKIHHDDFEILKKLDEEYRDFFGQNELRPRISKTDEELKNYWDTSVIAPKTLYGNLMEQAGETFESEKEKALAELIIGSLDERGLLATSLEELSVLAEATVKELEAILLTIQEFEPYGVGARTTQECLLIQLKRYGKEGSLAEKIVQECYEELLHNKIPLIQKKLNISPDEIRQVIEKDIAQLDLHPGTCFIPMTESYIIPDGEIKEENGKLVVVINDDSIPSLRLNRKYMRMLDDEKLPQETKEYIYQHMLSAKWLMKNVYQRNETIKRILDYLSVKQIEYLRNPKGELIPMFMTEVAEELNLHESTIARAVANKYVNTPRGLISLRSMFTFSYKKQDGSEISSQSVRDAIQRIVEQENKQKPFSDQKISNLLEDTGIPCARRTISKYRRDLNIGNAQQRRKY